MKILIAADGSEYTKKMLAYLASHKEMFGPNNDYTVATVQTPLPPRARAAVGAEVVKSYHADEADKVLGPAVKALLRQGIEAKSTWKVGPVGETLSKMAESGGFDLIVMGSHGHGAFGNLVMGSVATQVIAHCGVPVLLVR
ncbi:MAG: universal stress protein [Pseudomonadota bacterium]